jgi:hypothetical protein
MIKHICKKCGNELEKRDYRKYGIIGIVVGIAVFPLLCAIANGIFIASITFLILLIIGLYRIFKKDRFFYYCKKCGTKILESKLENKG